MAHDVFISHSSHDKPIADATCATLEANGIRCWIAPRDVVPGQDWGESIVTALKASRAVVLIFSEHANDSNQIKREVERAVSLGIPLLPVRVSDVMPSKSLEYFISSCHWLDAITPPHEKHILELADALNRLLHDKETSTNIQLIAENHINRCSPMPTVAQSSQQPITHTEMKRPFPLPMADNEQVLLAASCSPIQHRISQIWFLLLVLAAPGVWCSTATSVISQIMGYALLALCGLLVLGWFLEGRNRVIVTTQRIIVEQVLLLNEMSYEMIDTIQIGKVHMYGLVPRGTMVLKKKISKAITLNCLENVIEIERAIRTRMEEVVKTARN